MHLYELHACFPLVSRWAQYQPFTSLHFPCLSLTSIFTKKGPQHGRVPSLPHHKDSPTVWWQFNKACCYSSPVNMHIYNAGSNMAVRRVCRYLLNMLPSVLGVFGSLSVGPRRCDNGGLWWYSIPHSTP